MQRTYFSSLCKTSIRTVPLAMLFVSLSFSTSQAQSPAEKIRLGLEDGRVRDSIRLEKRNIWLAHQGKQADARTILTYYTPEFLEKHYRKYTTGDENARKFIERMVSFRAQDVAALYTVKDIAALSARGINVLTAVNSGGSLANIIATSDLVAIVEVTAVDTAAEGSDGRHSTVSTKVIRTFKGSYGKAPLYIRELTGKAPSSGIVTDAPGDMVIDSGTRLIPPSPGTRFLLFLSKNLYSLQVLYEDKIPLDDDNVYYLRVGPVYRVQDRQLIGQLPSEWKTSITEIEELVSPYK